MHCFIKGRMHLVVVMLLFICAFIHIDPMYVYVLIWSLDKYVACLLKITFLECMYINHLIIPIHMIHMLSRILIT